MRAISVLEELEVHCLVLRQLFVPLSTHFLGRFQCLHLIKNRVDDLQGALLAIVRDCLLESWKTLLTSLTPKVVESAYIDVRRRTSARNSDDCEPGNGVGRKPFVPWLDLCAHDLGRGENMRKMDTRRRESYAETGKEYTHE